MCGSVSYCALIYMICEVRGAIRKNEHFIIWENARFIVSCNSLHTLAYKFCCCIISCSADDMRPKWNDVVCYYADGESVATPSGVIISDNVLFFLSVYRSVPRSHRWPVAGRRAAARVVVTHCLIVPLVTCSTARSVLTIAFWQKCSYI